MNISNLSIAGNGMERMENIPTLDNELDNFNRKKTSRDPLSHRVIEKRRRDRMNKCLQDLGRLIPQHYMKKSKSRIEKTEIVEMAIKHLKNLSASQKNHSNACREECRKKYQMGYQECMSETIRFLVEMEEMSFKDGLCMRIVNHLQNHITKLNQISQINHFDAVIQKPKLNTYDEPTVKPLQMEVDERRQSVSVDVYSDKNVEPSQDIFNEQHSPATIRSTASPTSPNGEDSHSRNKYKFKQNMKERFQADVMKDCSRFPVNNPTTPIQNVPQVRITTEADGISSDSSVTTTSSFGKPRLNNNALNNKIMPNDTNNLIIGRKDLYKPNLVLPAFVLHPSESYYIPIKLNVSCISHLFTNYNNSSGSNNNNSNKNASNIPIFNLYPVNITVNFCFFSSSLEVTVTSNH